MPTSSASLTRKTYLDILRIFSMFAVVLIHVIGSAFFAMEDVTSVQWIKFNVLDSALRWCVPIFVMISGSLFLDPQKKITVKQIYKKYIFRIFTAFTFWSAIYGLMNYIQYPRNLDFIHTCFDYLTTVFLKPSDHLWFVYMITGLYIITPMLRKIVAASSQKELQYWLVVMFSLGLFPYFLRSFPLFDQYFGSAIDNANLSFLFGYVFYYVAGYYFSYYPVSHERWFYSAGVIGYLITVLGSQYFSIITKRNNVIYNNMYPNTAIIAIAIYILFVNRISKIQFSDTCRKRLETVSNAMFGVYLSHVLWITGINYAGIGINKITSICWALFLSFIVLLISCMVILLLQKIGFFKRYLS